MNTFERPTISVPLRNNDQQDCFYIEDLSEDLMKKFISQQLHPYLKNVYADLLLRSAPAKDPRYNHLVDKVTLCEFTQLPGLMSDRFNALCGSNHKYQEGRISETNFMEVMTAVYASTVD